MQQCIYWSFLSSKYFGRIRPSSGALDVKLQHTIFCSWWWAYAPETYRAKETSINYIVASSWHFTLFYHRFFFSVTENHDACPINGEDEEWKDVILTYFREFPLLLHLFFYLSYAFDENFNDTIVNTLFKNIFILGMRSDSFPGYGSCQRACCTAPGGRCVNREHWRNENWQGVPECSEKNRSQWPFVHKNHIPTALVSKSGLDGEKPGISHGREPLIWTLQLLEINLSLCSKCIYCIL